MIKIYIASPYTLGSQTENVRTQLDAFKFLITEGFTPFAPLLSHFIELVHPMSWEKWLEWDFEWLGSCDYLLRLDGESKGADLEVAKAREMGIPVFYSFQELLKEKPNLRKRI